MRDATGYDVRRCGRCSYCVHFVTPEDDVSLEMMMQLVMQNDEEVLTSKTLWSDEALKRARHDVREHDGCGGDYAGAAG